MSDEHAATTAQDLALDALVALAVRLAAAERIAPPPGEAALRAIADAAAAAVRVTAVSMAIHDAATDALVFRVAAGREGHGVAGLSIASHEGIAGYAFSAGQPLAVADVRADPRFEQATAERTGYVPRSILAVPLADDDGVVGVMELLDRRDGEPFDLADVELGTRFATAATATIRATRLQGEATGLLADTLAAVGNATYPAEASSPGAPRLDRPDVDALVRAVIDRLPHDDAVWRLADRIGRLRKTDPEDMTLAIDWLDAL
ncbi:MAG: GAF domain-containing protein, partial [Chloroflexota bacterium]